MKWTAVVVASSLAACSYVTMKPRTPPDCGSSIPVIVDGTASIGSFVGGLLGVQTLVQEPSASKALPALEASAGLIAGTVFLISSIHGQRLLRACSDAGEAPPSNDMMKKVSTREAAYALTKQAREAARKGDCATVKDLAPKVRDADAEFYEVIFQRDAALARCMR